jgi:rod shape determining protein RodA
MDRPLFSRVREGILGPIAHIDWILLSAALLVSAAGLVTMNSFTAENYFFERQLMWLGISLIVFFAFSFIDFRFLKRTSIIVLLFVASVVLLSVTLIIGEVFLGAQSWIDLGAFSIQTSDPIKIVMLLILAKYFSRRHVEIAHYKHILISGAYMAIIAGLVFIQPDFGSAIIIVSLWLGMILVAGISKKHLAVIVLTGLLSVGGLWLYVFEDYQKQRIISFLNPLTDLQGAGYNAYQSTVAVGSGQIMGKGVGFGTQSRLEFLPEYETDFIFAAFAEEWGFVGVTLLLTLFVIIIWRLLMASVYGSSNFETLFGIGIAVLFMSHITIHIGMNVGLLPVTGTTLPFMSYGGSHLVTECAALGIFMGMRKYERPVHRDDFARELIGVTVPR